MRYNIIFAVLITLTACTAAKLPVPQEFSSRSEKMPVKGLNGWLVSQKLSFGNYQTSNIKRGWNFKSSVQYTRFSLKPEEGLLRVLDVNIDNNSLKQKNKFQYTIEGDNAIAEVYATEQFSEKQLVYKSNNPYIGSASKTKKYEYAFTAAIVPVTIKNADPWSLVLINTYDITKNTSRKVFDKPYVAEEGYATDGKESFAIAPLRVDKLATGNGKETKVVGGNLLGGYEIIFNNKTISIIDILENAIWISNDLEPAKKIVVSSIASAILLKRMQDAEKDKDEL